MAGCQKSHRETEFLKRSIQTQSVRDDDLEALICDCIQLLLPTLPTDEAEVVYAIDVEGASPQSVAGQQALSLDEVASLLANGRMRLQRQFGEMLVVCLQHGLSGCDCLPVGEVQT